MKKKKTEKQIADAFLKIAEKKPLNQITITAVCSEMNIARTTFYYYFTSIDDLLDKIENHFFEAYAQLIHRYNMKNRALDQNDLAHVQKLLMENEHFLRIIFVSNPDPRFAYRWQQHIRSYFGEYLMHNEVKLEIISSIMLALYKNWLVNITDLQSREVTKANIWLLDLIQKKVY